MVAVVVEHDDRTISIWQRYDLGHQSLDAIGAVASGTICIHHVLDVAEITQRNLRSFLGFEPVEANAPRDAADPGAEFVGLAERRQRAEPAKERFLGKILRDLGRAHPCVADGHDARTPAPGKNCISIGPARQRLAYEVGFRGFIHYEAAPSQTRPIPTKM